MMSLARDPTLTAVRDAIRQRSGDAVRIDPTEIGRLLSILRARSAANQLAVIRSMGSGKGEQWWEDDHDRGGPQGEDRKVGGLPALEPVERAASCEESGG
jgi:hypothetical protein